MQEAVMKEIAAEEGINAYMYKVLGQTFYAAGGGSLSLGVLYMAGIWPMDMYIFLYLVVTAMGSSMLSAALLLPKTAVHHTAVRIALLVFSILCLLPLKHGEFFVSHRELWGLPTSHVVLVVGLAVAALALVFGAILEDLSEACRKRIRRRISVSDLYPS